MRAVSIVAGENPGAREQTLRNFDSESHRSEDVDAALEMLALDRRGRRDYSYGIAGFKSRRFNQFPVHNALRASLSER